MTRVRLREARPEGEAAFYIERYPDGYRHDVWPDHVERVTASVDLIGRYQHHIRTAADLSAGDGAILREVARYADHVCLGDLADPGPKSPWWTIPNARVLPAGPLPDTLEHLDDEVDLFVLSETLEHLDDPDALLRVLTGFAQYLFLSTPVEESPAARNPEHYWSWGTGDVYDMLTAAGWHPLERQILVPQSTLALPHAYHYQMWMAVKAR